jgi:hypothetical protein
MSSYGGGVLPRHNFPSEKYLSLKEIPLCYYPDMTSTIKQLI